MATLFTIGYEHHPTPDSLISTLSGSGVRRLVDVRELPQSRRRGFSKTALSAALAEAAISYEHVRELGNPKHYRDLYRAGRSAEGKQLYRSYLENGSAHALIELRESLEGVPTCLLCFEASPELCHRSVITEALSAQLDDLTVVHLQ
jgi:uncharacterized protein (DUF488 family)